MSYGGGSRIGIPADPDETADRAGERGPVGDGDLLRTWHGLPDPVQRLLFETLKLVHQKVRRAPRAFARLSAGALGAAPTAHELLHALHLDH